MRNLQGAPFNTNVLIRNIQTKQYKNSELEKEGH